MTTQTPTKMLLENTRHDKGNMCALGCKIVRIDLLYYRIWLCARACVGVYM